MKILLTKLLEKLGSGCVGLAVLLECTTVAHAQTETYFFHTDHLGTPKAVTDTSQQVLWQGEYNPFGEVIETVNLIEKNLRFPGQYFDEETGLHYNCFRDYDLSIGRYVESDPIGLPQDLRLAVASYKEVKHRDGDDPIPAIEIKLHDKLRALEVLAKHLNLFNNEPEFYSPEELTITVVRAGDDVHE